MEPEPDTKSEKDYSYTEEDFIEADFDQLDRLSVAKKTRSKVLENYSRRAHLAQLNDPFCSLTHRKIGKGASSVPHR